MFALRGVRPKFGALSDLKRFFTYVQNEPETLKDSSRSLKRTFLFSIVILNEQSE